MSERDDDPSADPPATDLAGDAEQRWFDEPDEPDAESFGLDVPTPDGEAADNPEIVQLFWKLVLVFNVAILALAVGPMLVVFEDRWNLGVQVFAAGVLAFAYGTARYYRFRAAGDEDGGDQ